MLWGLCGFSTEAIYAAAAVYNCNVKTAILFFALKKTEIHAIYWLIGNLCVFPHALKS